ncbi:MAG TPA: sigma-70 family RNA polymerase sigma factor [Anaerolineaceae bacterium]
MHNSITQDSSRLLQQEEEAQWIGEAKANPESFAKLYDCYAPNIYRYLLSRLGNVAGAQDVTSQTFLRAFEMFPRYRHTGYFSAWLFAIARSKYVDYLRKTKNQPETIPDSVKDPQDDLLQEVIRSERLVELKVIIHKLPEEEQELLRLRFVAGLSFSEMASLLERNEDAVKKTLYRLLARLQNQLEE